MAVCPQLTYVGQVRRKIDHAWFHSPPPPPFPLMGTYRGTTSQEDSVLFLYLSLTQCYQKKYLVLGKKEEKSSLRFYWHIVELLGLSPMLSMPRAYHHYLASPHDITTWEGIFPWFPSITVDAVFFFAGVTFCELQENW